VKARVRVARSDFSADDRSVRAALDGDRSLAQPPGGQGEAVASAVPRWMGACPPAASAENLRGESDQGQHRALEPIVRRMHGRFERLTRRWAVRAPADIRPRPCGRPSRRRRLGGTYQDLERRSGPVARSSA
jgi:hypothetical protein